MADNDRSKTAFYITDVKQGEAALRVAALYRDGIPDRLEVRDKAKESRVGRIVLGVVDTVERSIGGAFVRIGHTERAFMPLRDGSMHGVSKLPVLITKDAQGVKQAVASDRLSVAGRYTVLTEGKKGLAFSSKLGADRKQELKELLKEAGVLSGPQSGQEREILVRTNAAGATSREILDELAELEEALRSVHEKAKTAGTYAVLYEPPAFYLTMLRDLPEYPETIMSDIPKVIDAIDGCQVHHNPCIAFPDYIDLPHTLYKLQQRVAWLKSGAYLVIEPTEALTAIDVNTGHMRRGKKPQETYRQVNEEAITEAARQIRLRNLSGMILIDLIKMKDEEAFQSLVPFAKKAFKDDPVHVDVVDISKLGLLEIIRQKTSAPLGEILGTKGGQEHGRV